MAAPDWWKTFFSGVAVDFWLAVPTAEQTRAEADFLQEELRLTPGARILDVACGGGRHALELAARGFRVMGVDISSEFLKTARAASAERELPVDWEQRDVQDLPWFSEFDAAYCLGNGFGYLDDVGNAAVLQGVGRALKPGGRFVLETGMVAESLLPALKDNLWYRFGDILFLVRNSYDHVHSRLDMDMTFVRGGQVDNRPISQRVYTYNELCRLFEAAGLGDVTAYGGLDRQPFGFRSSHALLTATRRAGP
jgi:SAM-dependent methyltransferase